MKLLLIASLFIIQNIAHSVEHFPLPKEVDIFYQDIMPDVESSCVNTLSKVDIVTGPQLYINFYENGKPQMPAGASLIFSNFHAYDEDFNYLYKITQAAHLETLDLILYDKGCGTLPFGTDCLVKWVDRRILKIVKEHATGKVVEASLKQSVRRLSWITGKLKKRWDESGIIQYSCKNGKFSETIK